MLQFSNLRFDQRREPCIRVNTRELNRELCTRLSILYTTGLWFVLSYFSLLLNNHMLNILDNVIILEPFISFYHDHVTMTCVTHCVIMMSC